MLRLRNTKKKATECGHLRYSVDNSPFVFFFCRKSVLREHEAPNRRCACMTFLRHGGTYTSLGSIPMARTVFVFHENGWCLQLFFSIWYVCFCIPKTVYYRILPPPLSDLTPTPQTPRSRQTKRQSSHTSTVRVHTYSLHPTVYTFSRF